MSVFSYEIPEFIEVEGYKAEHADGLFELLWAHRQKTPDRRWWLAAQEFPWLNLLIPEAASMHSITAETTKSSGFFRNAAAAPHVDPSSLGDRLAIFATQNGSTMFGCTITTNDDEINKLKLSGLNPADSQALPGLFGHDWLLQLSGDAPLVKFDYGTIRDAAEITNLVTTQLPDGMRADGDVRTFLHSSRYVDGAARRVICRTLYTQPAC